MLQNVGFKVFGPQAGRTYATGGAQPGLRPNVAGNLISTEPGPYTIQVYNFDPTTPIEYELGLASNRPEGEQVAGSAPTPLDLGGAPAAGGAVVLVDSHFHATPVWYDRVESALQDKPEREMSTEEVGAFVMNELRHLDKVAYVRFASVYRHFRDIGEFMTELKDLLNAKE